MESSTLDKLTLAHRQASSVGANLDDLARRLSSVGMDKLAKEVTLYANDVFHVSEQVNEATGEAVATYYRQSVEGSTNVIRAALVGMGANPDEIFVTRKDS